MAKCRIQNGLIDITGLTIDEAHQIKLALIHIASKNLPRTTREERIFNTEMVTGIDMIQNEFCSSLEMQSLCV